MTAIRLARGLGVLVALLGVVVLVGWALGVHALTKVLPHLPPMKANTALCFTLAGLALVLSTWPDTRAVKFARGGALLVGAIGLMTFIEWTAGVDFGMDERLFADPGTSHPGRMAIGTSVGFVLVGIALCLNSWAARAPRMGAVARRAGLAVAAIGALGLFGHFLDLELLRALSAFDSVAMHTAGGLAVLGASVRFAAGIGRPETTDYMRIVGVETWLLVLAAGASAIVVLAAMERELKNTHSSGLDQTLKYQVSQIETTFELSTTIAETIASRPDMLRHLRRLVDDPRDSESRSVVQAVLESFATHGFTAIAVTLSNGDEAARFGEPIKSAAAEIPIAVGRGRAFVLWRDGLYLRHLIPLRDGGVFLGTVTAEQYLQKTTQVLHASETLGESAELLVCRHRGQAYDCLPTRFRPEPFTLQAHSDGPDRFVYGAVEAKLRSGSPLGAGGTSTLGSYAAIGATGLIAVLMVNTKELWHPVAVQMGIVLVLVTAIALVGAYLVRARVRPLATALETRVQERTRELTASNVRLAQSEQRFHCAVDAAPNAMLMVGEDGRIALANVQAGRLFGYAQSELMGLEIERLLPHWFRAAEPGLRAANWAGPRVRAGRNLVGLRKDGSEVAVEIGLNPIEMPEGRFVLSALVDITERTRGEKERDRLVGELHKLNSELNTALKEREVLLLEIHHRVKNNLQVVSSLINIQMRKLAPGTSRSALAECQTRIQAIALIHEKLYQSRDYSHVLFADYARGLVRNVFHATGISPSAVTLEIEIATDIALPVDKAIPYGLILNELITNALKHAFPEGRRGVVRVEMARSAEGRVMIAVKDDGVGLPADVDVRQSESLGMQLVATLAEQLHANLEVVRESPGTLFQLTFQGV